MIMFKEWRKTIERKYIAPMKMISLTYFLSLNNKPLHSTIQKHLKSLQMWLNLAIWPKAVPSPFTPYMLQQLLTLKTMSKQRTSQNTGMNNFMVKHIWSYIKNPRCHKPIWIPLSDLMWHEQLKMLEVGVMSLVDKKPKINLRWSRYYEIHRSAKADLKCQCWYEVPSLSGSVNVDIKSQVWLEGPMSIWC